MTAFFNQLLQNSLSGSLLILGILLFRKAAGSLSKLYVRLLWLAAFSVLVFPPVSLGSLYTVRDLVLETENTLFRKEDGKVGEPKAEDAAGATTWGESAQTFQESLVRGQGEVPEGLRSRGEGNRTQPDGFEPDLTEILVLFWAMGAAGLTIISFTKWLQLKRRVSVAVRIFSNVWSTERISTPFVMPGFPSVIYISRELEKEKGQLEDILKHERRHICNKDPWIKCFALPVLILHWFNPLVWLAFCLMSRDMEMYCDECVLRGKSMEEKKHYCQTLLDFACKSRGFSPALHFGESSTKSRIRHVLHTRHPHAVISLLLLLFISGCSLSFLTTKEEDPGQPAAANPGEELLPETLPDETDDGSETENIQEEHWANKLIVGIGHEGLEPGFDEEEMDVMGRTEHFALYSMHDREAMAVKTPDCLVYAEVPLISNYEIEPLIMERDFDSDGEEELAIITYVLHGTGLSIRSLFMTDHTDGGQWNIYQYRDQDYLTELTPHFDTQYREEGVRLVFDGTPVGVVQEVDQEELDNGYGYYAGSLTDFRFVEENIYLRAGLTGYSDINFAGEYSGHELDARVNYLGEGKWELTNIRYADAEITDVLEETIPLYLTGRTGEMNGYHTIPGVQLSDFEEPCKEVTILSISYPLEELVTGETQAYVTVRRDKEDSLVYLHVPMKRVPLNDGKDRWRIAGEILLEK